MRSASSPPAFARSSRIRPNAACVDCSSPAGAGMAGTLTLPKLRGTLLARDRLLLEQGFDGRARIAADASERLPLVALANTHRLAQSRDLGRVHQARVIVLVAGEGQAEALDRVGDEQSRLVVAAAVERLDQVFEIVAGEIRSSAGAARRRLRLSTIARRLRRVREQPLAPRLAAEIGERRILGVAARSIQSRSAVPPGSRNAGFEELAVLQRHTRQPQLAKISSKRSNMRSELVASRLWRL